jgi:hypothetical protein
MEGYIERREKGFEGRVKGRGEEGSSTRLPTSKRHFEVSPTLWGGFKSTRK